jgi:hypothetical protein
MRSVLFLTIGIFLFSCGEGEKKEPERKFVSESILIDNAEIPYQYDSIPLILEKVGLCSTVLDSLKPDSLKRPPCDYKLFRYFANNPEPFKRGFLVEVKPRIWSPYYLVVNIAVNQDGDFYKSNAFHGQLIELRTTPSGNYDMIIRYIDTEVGTVAVLHKWNKTKYDPVEVVEINDRYVKPEKKDSLNEVYLKNFVWGY